LGRDLQGLPIGHGGEAREDVTMDWRKSTLTQPTAKLVFRPNKHGFSSTIRIRIGFGSKSGSSLIFITTFKAGTCYFKSVQIKTLHECIF
jgi:hypothetical protein